MKIRSRKISSTIMVICATAAVIIAMQLSGLMTWRNAMRIGYAGFEGWKSWSADYTLLNGTMKRTLHLGDPCVLRIETETQDGELSIEINGKSGETLFSENDLGTGTFDVEVSGNVVVTIAAKKHKGSFKIEQVDE